MCVCVCACARAFVRVWQGFTRTRAGYAPADPSPPPFRDCLANFDHHELSASRLTGTGQLLGASGQLHEGFKLKWSTTQHIFGRCLVSHTKFDRHWSNEGAAPDPLGPPPGAPGPRSGGGWAQAPREVGGGCWTLLAGTLAASGSGGFSGWGLLLSSLPCPDPFLALSPSIPSPLRPRRGIGPPSSNPSPSPD